MMACGQQMLMEDIGQMEVNTEEQWHSLEVPPLISTEFQWLSSELDGVSSSGYITGRKGHNFDNGDSSTQALGETEVQIIN